MISPQDQTLARQLLDCDSARCHLCAHCLHIVRAELGLSDTGWPKTSDALDPAGELAQRIIGHQRKRAKRTARS